MRLRFKSDPAFTLIELLIVVAIIAILAAIAIPNFLEAQTRSKVSRVKADFRSLATAIEAYCSDCNKYPWSIAVGHVIGEEQIVRSLYCLTTPTAYIGSVSMRDPFGSSILYRGPRYSRPVYMYISYEPIRTVEEGDWAANAQTHYTEEADKQSMVHRAFMLWSCGPDMTDNQIYWCDVDWYHNPIGYLNLYITFIYDATNGTISSGDIARLGGEYRARLPLN
jgi:prepilin-type N-terminal cleavage/methylation domain-containing protein